MVQTLRRCCVICQWSYVVNMFGCSFLGNPALCGNWLSSPCNAHAPQRRASISKAAVLAIAFGSVATFLMILVAVCRPYKPKSIIDGPPSKPVNNFAPKLVILHMNMALHVYEDIMRMTDNSSEKYIIGCSASSTVYKCMLKNCRPIAIKRLFKLPTKLEGIRDRTRDCGEH